MTSLYPKLLSWVDNNQRVALLTVIESGRSEGLSVGAKLVVSESGQVLLGEVPGALREAVVAFAMERLQQGAAASKALEVGRERLVIYGEPVAAEPEVFLFGGGHCGRAIAHAAALAGFQVVVVEDRPEFARPEDFPEGTQFRVGAWHEGVAQLAFHPNAYLVIVTRAHAFDSDLLLQLIDKPSKYLGMIGSRKKVETVFNRLREHEISQERIARVHAPIGIDIGAQTPGEIAISIVAEMIAVKYGKTER